MKHDISLAEHILCSRQYFFMILGKVFFYNLETPSFAATSSKTRFTLQSYIPVVLYSLIIPFRIQKNASAFFLNLLLFSYFSQCIG